MLGAGVVAAEIGDMMIDLRDEMIVREAEVMVVEDPTIGKLLFDEVPEMVETEIVMEIGTDELDLLHRSDRCRGEREGNRTLRRRIKNL